MEKEKIKKEVEEIIKQFMEKLKEVEEEINLDTKDFYLIERNNIRKEKEDNYLIKSEKFKEKWFKIAPNHDKDYIIAEKAKWKK